MKRTADTRRSGPRFGAAELFFAEAHAVLFRVRHLRRHAQPEPELRGRREILPRQRRHDLGPVPLQRPVGYPGAALRQQGRLPAGGSAGGLSGRDPARDRRRDQAGPGRAVAAAGGSQPPQHVLLQMVRRRRRHDRRRAGVPRATTNTSRRSAFRCSARRNPPRSISGRCGRPSGCSTTSTRWTTTRPISWSATRRIIGARTSCSSSTTRCCISRSTNPTRRATACSSTSCARPRVPALMGFVVDVNRILFKGLNSIFYKKWKVIEA